MAWLVTGFVRAQYAERVNAAADLAEAGVPVAEAARVLAGRFGCSVRQARRYAEQAAQSGRAEVPAGHGGVHGQAAGAGWPGGCARMPARPGLTISAVVAQALEEFLERGRRNHPRR